MQDNPNIADTSNAAEENTTDTAAEQSDKIKDINLVIEYLAQSFPNCFSVKGAAKPIKIGIFQDLAQRVDEDGKVSRTVLRSALRKYTSSWRYLAVVTEGAMRVDVDGNEIEAVEAEHAEHAKTTLKESKQKAAEKRKQSAPKKDGAKGNPNKKGPRTHVKRPPKKADVEVKVKKRRVIDLENLSVGQKISVAMGKSPIDATIKEINGNEIVVETFSGFTVKTDKKSIV